MRSFGVHRYREQRDRPDLTLPETLQLYLETRFDQLKVCHVCVLVTILFTRTAWDSSGERTDMLAASACTSMMSQAS